MSSFVVSNATISSLARGIVDIFDLENLGKVHTALCTDELLKQFADCKLRDSYDLNKVGKKLLEMNIMAYEQRYKHDPVEITEFSYEKGENPIQKHYLTNRYGNQNGYPFDIVPFYKQLQCYRYQCDEGSVDKTELFIALEHLEYRLAAHIIAKTEAYENAPWG